MLRSTAVASRLISLYWQPTLFCGCILRRRNGLNNRTTKSGTRTSDRGCHIAVDNRNANCLVRFAVGFDFNFRFCVESIGACLVIGKMRTCVEMCLVGSGSWCQTRLLSMSSLSWHVDVMVRMRGWFAKRLQGIPRVALVFMKALR